MLAFARYLRKNVAVWFLQQKNKEKKRESLNKNSTTITKTINFVKWEMQSE